MNRFAGLFVVAVLGSTVAWAQAGAPAAAQPTAAAQAAVTGCMTQWFGEFKVADPTSNKSWNVKGNGAALWNQENHIVKVQGLSDPQAQTPTIYAQSVQDTGQACGSAAASNAGTAQPGTAQQPANTTGATGTTGTAPAGTATPEPQPQPGGGVSQPSAPPTTPQTAAPQSQASTANEDKGVPTAGTSVTTNAAQQQPADDNQIFTGCLVGSLNNYQFKANGKTYHIQGNTASLNSMVNHQVELTGEDFNGKAIQVNGARDLGGSCKK
ncbi:MAG TPA: hypothetical protein VG897_06395 [Terriglobales bacterium]|nr:hypothetical protein [Terriglobales bacterium]